MNTLVIATVITPEFMDLIVHENGQVPVTIVSTQSDVINACSSVGIYGYLLRQKKMDISYMDKMFADAMMPGNMIEYGNISDSDLPIWKVVSLDRLKFWFDHSAKINMDLINNLAADKVYVSLDISSQYILAMMNSKAYRIGVQTGPIRTPDFYFLSNILDFDEYIVQEEEDAQFLTKVLGKKNVKSLGKTPRNGRKIIGYPERKRIKEQIGLSGRVVGIMFDKQDEWQTRKFLSEYGHNPTILVFPTDQRSLDLAPVILRKYDVIFHTDKLPMLACDELVAFRWDEMHYTGTVPDTLKIIDYNGINLATKLAPDWIEVFE